MSDQPPPPYRLVIRPCTIHAGHYRWDIQRGEIPIQSSLKSFGTQQEAHEDGTREFEQFTKILKVEIDDMKRIIKERRN